MGPTPSDALETERARRVLVAVSAVLLGAGLVAAVLRSAPADPEVGTRSATTAPPTVLDAPSASPSSAPTSTVAQQRATGADEPVAAPAPRPDPAAPASPAPDGAPTEHAATLRDKTFESVSVVEDGSGERTFADGGAVTVRFEGTDDGDVVRWRISCNTAGGRVTVSADRITVDEVSSSAVGCGPEREAEDTWIASFFDSSPGWTLDGDRLTLRSGGTVIVLEESTSA